MPLFEAPKVDRMSDREIERAVDQALHSLIPRLREQGFNRDELREAVAGCLSRGDDVKVDPSDAIAQVACMNLIGGLRSAGYEVTGGRAGGKVYQIKGHRPPVTVTSKTISEAPPETKEAYSWLQECGRLIEKETSDWINEVDAMFARRATGFMLHQTNWLQIWAYRGAGRNKIHYVRHRGCVCLVVQKFTNRPKLSVIYGAGPPADALDLCILLAPASLGRMSISGMTECSLPAWLEASSAIGLKFQTSNRETAVYDMWDLLDHPEKYLNKRARSTLRARLRDTQIDRNPSVADQRNVVVTWRQRNEAKHRQLAINRDFVAIDSKADGKVTTGGIREGHPVCHHLVYRLPNRSDAVMLANEKSLNYSDVPGGKYGLSDWNQWTMAEVMRDLKLRYMQSGGIDGGGFGLGDKKRKYACQIVNEPELTLDLPTADY